MSSPPLERRRVLYSGDVQGVGFRYTTLGVAAGHAVTGLVRNLRDSRVEVVVEGSSSAVEAFLAEVAQTMARHINHVEADRGTATGEWDSFVIGS